MQGDCTKEDTYVGCYDALNSGDKGHFYIEFTNSVDYQKTIESYKFIVEE